MTQAQSLNKLFFSSLVVLLLIKYYSDFVEDNGVEFINPLCIVEAHQGCFEIVRTEILHANE